MKRLKKMVALLLSMVLLLSGINIGRTEVQAAGGNHTSGKLVIKLFWSSILVTLWSEIFQLKRASIGVEYLL